MYVSENRFGFMPESSTIEAIRILKRLIERSKEKKRDQHMILIDLKRTYKRMPREVSDMF